MVQAQFESIQKAKNSMMYQAYQTHADALSPLRAVAKTIAPLLDLPHWNTSTPVRKAAAACEVIKLAELTHKRREFGIHMVTVGGQDVTVREVAAHITPFGTLLHFEKDIRITQPRVLIVAPMSGHFATLLRETVRTMLTDHDVYITDWHNARDVPLQAGRFGLDEYTEHLMTFLGVMGAGAHLVAICQPCVSALAAVALMSEDQHEATPVSLTLMAGPIDCRISPTAVNKLATSKSVAWFERNLVSTVPWRHGGALRRVYPGFVQIAAFMNMNPDRHIRAFRELYRNLVSGDMDKANATRGFYNEYFAVADLPAEFYLETVKLVFQEYALPRGKLKWRGRKVDPRAIRRTALLTVEGEKDDICSLGQTLAAHDLCSGLRPYMRTHYVEAGAGHYGVFSGRRWNQHIYPVVREGIHAAG
jgi:poly(3-hydroxybutyrate) depolymerase